MAGMDFFIRPATGTGSADWIRIPNADIDVKIARRLTRTIIRGGEGDNLHDEGAESTIYTVRGILSIDDYKKILKMFRTGQPFIHDPFEERDVKVIFASLEYEGSTDTTKNVYTNKAITNIRKLVTEGYVKIARDTQDVEVATEKVTI